MRITKLAYQKNNPNRVNVFVDGKFAVGLNTDEVLKLKIANGQEINQEQLNKIIDQSNFGKALNAAINFLSFRPRSEWEIRQFLRRKKYENVELVVEKLKSLGQIDDEKFAQWWVEQRNTFRPKGQRAINAELARKGVKVKIKVDNEKELAAKLLNKKVFKSKDQALRYFLSRGFSYDTIETIIEKAKIKE